MSQKYDLAVIGAGPGGYVAALRAAQLGMKVVCIDKRETLGGTCLNVGCIPSKALLQSTELYAHVQHEGKKLGLQYADLSFDFVQTMKRKEEVVQSLINGVAGLFKKQQVAFLNGEAQFIDSHHLLVTSHEVEVTVEASYIIVATGSESISLPFLPFQQDTVLSSTEILSLKEVPEKMVVVGGGVIGVELASVYNRLGSKVTIVEMLPTICPTMDQAISKQLLQSLKNQGIEFMLSTQLTDATIQTNAITLSLKHEQEVEEVSANIVLVAIGRKPFIDNLALDKATVQVDKKGFISVDSCFRTSQPHIFAVGDVIDGAMLAHRASQEGVAVVEWINGEKPLIDYMSIPNVIYTYPEVAAVGMTEEEASAAGLDLSVGTAYFKGNPRARCAGETEGFLKVIADQKTTQILGMHIIGPHASEIITAGILMIQKKMTLKEVANTVIAHPTLSESIKEAVMAALGQPLHG